MTSLEQTHTYKEIAQQPKLWRKTYNRIKEQKQEIQSFLKQYTTSNKSRVLLSGAGSSAYIGESVAPTLNHECSLSFDAHHTTDIVTHPNYFFDYDSPDVVVSYARSGNSPESVATFDLANQLTNDVGHVIFTCNPDGKLAKEAENRDNVLLILMPEEANDKSLAMTSSFSTMTLASLLVFDIDHIERYERLIDQVASQGEAALSLNIYQQLIDQKFTNVIYLASYPLMGITKEASLKMLELSDGNIKTLADSPLGFRHGPKSAINNHSLVIAFLSPDEYVKWYEQDLLNELAADGQSTLAVLSPYTDSKVKHSSDFIHKIENNMDESSSVLLMFPYLIFAQQLAMYTADYLNINPDNPSPEGQINRVVKGVTIYPYYSKGDSYE